MQMNEYQHETRRTATGGEASDDMRLAIFALGVAGEAGEVADLIKKWLGHGRSRDIPDLVGELGDVLWYIAAIADRCGVTLEEVALYNVKKLRTKYPNGFNHHDANAPRT